MTGFRKKLTNLIHLLAPALHFICSLLAGCDVRKVHSEDSLQIDTCFFDGWVVACPLRSPPFKHSQCAASKKLRSKLQ